MFLLNNRFPLYPDELSNEFGSVNLLESSGGVFDEIETGNTCEPSGEPSDSIPSSEKEPSSVTDPSPAGDASKTQEKETVKNKTEKKSGAKMRTIALMILAAAAGLCAFIFLKTHVMIGELFGKHELYASDVTEIDLSGSDYSDYKALSGLKSLETIVLTNSSISKLSDLYGCDNLKRVVLTDRELSANECMEFYGHMPKTHLICKVNIAGKTYDSEVTQLTAEDVDSETQLQYAALSNLKRLDLTACEVSDSTFRTLSKALPDCLIIMRTTICGKEYTTDAETIKFEGTVTKGEVNQIGFFKKLHSIDIRNCTNPDALSDFLAKNPQIKTVESVQLLGKQFGAEDAVIDLRGNQYTLSQVKAALDEALPKMTSLKKIDMCGCGLSDKEMEKLTAAYPNIKFVWMLHVGRWDIRTDAVMFSALNSDGKEIYDQKDYAPIFKYCTDLRAIDLGHSLITDISEMASLKKLRAVILTDNKVKDISAFKEMKDLEFIEMNATNKVTNLEPLRELQNLRFINMWGSVGITDLSPLYHHDKLEIVIFERTIPREEQKRFISSNPNCQSFFKVDSNRVSTNPAWRDNPYRIKLKNTFGKKNDKGILIREWKYVVGFDERTGDYMMDYNTDQYSVM